MADSKIGIRLALEGADQVRGSLAGVEQGLDRLNTGLAKIGHYGTALLALPTVFNGTVGAAVKAADAVTTLNNQLRLATGSTQAAGQAYTALFDIAQRSRVSFTELGGTFAAISRAGQELGISQTRLLTVTEAIGNAMTVSGGSAQGMQAALTQLGQGLASGTLRGEELNSVMEQTPRLAKALADGLGVTTGKLREMGAAGQITSDQVIRALEGQAAVLRGEVQGAVLTVGQAFVQLENATVKAIGEFDKASGASSTLAQAMSGLASGMTAAGKAFADNEAAIKTTLGLMAGAGVGIGLARTASALGGVAAGVGGVAGAVTALKLVVSGLNPATLALMGIGAAVGGFVAYNAALAKTSDGIRATIKELEALSKTPSIYDRNPEGIAKWEAANVKRTEQIKALRQQLALMNSEGLDTKAEDARLAATVAAAKGNAKLAATYDDLRTRLSGFKGDHAKYQADLASIQKGMELGKDKGGLSQSEGIRLLTELAKKHGEVAKATKASSTEIDEFAKALEKVQAKESGLNSDYASTLSTLYAGYQKGRIGADDYAAAVESLIKQQPVYAAGLKAQAELTKDLAKSMEGAQKIAAAYANEADKAAEQLINAVSKLADENELIGLNTEARAAALVVRQEQILADTELALLMAQNIEGNETQIKALEREVNLRKQLIAGMREGAAKTAKVDRDKDAADSAKKAADEWQKASDKIEQDLTDALMRGFESGKGFAENMRSTLENMFKTMVLRPVISAIVSPVAGAITNAITGGAGGLLGAASNASSLYNAGSAAYNWLGLGASAGTGIAASAGAGLSLASTGTGLGLSAGATGLGLTGTAASGASLGSGLAASSGAAAGGASSLMAAAPWLLGGLAVASLLKSLDDSGTMHTGGLGSYSKAGGAATGNAVKGQNAGFFNLAQADYQASTEQASVAMAQALVGMLDSTANTFGKSAGYYAATAFADDTSKDGAWGSLLVRIGDKVVADWGAGGPGYLGREFADGQAGANQYSAAIGASIRDLLIEQTPDWADTMLQALGDAPSIEALAETVGQITATENALQGMGRASQAFANIGDEVAGQLIAAMGGAQAAAQAMAGYYANFYSDTERNTIARTQFAEAAATIGITDLPTTRAGYRDMIDGYMAAGDTERAGKLIQYSGAFASFTDAPAAPNYTAATSAANDLQNAVDKLAEKFANAQTSLADTAASLGIELLRAMGDTQGALAAERAQYLAGFADLGQAEQARLGVLYDQNQAIRDQITAIEKTKLVGEERKGLESQILQLQGNTTALRALELATLDESNRALQLRIYALQDEAAGLANMRSFLTGVIDTAASQTDAALAGAERAIAADTKKAQISQEAAKSLVADVKSIFDTLKSAVADLYDSVDSTRATAAITAQQTITEALAVARATGSVPEGQDLTAAIAAAKSGIDGTQYASQYEADFARLQLAGELRDLQDISGDQLTEAEKQLKVSESQLSTLEDQLSAYREQIDVMRGVDSSVQSVASAIDALVAAMALEASVRAQVKATNLIGSGQAIYNVGTGTGTNASGAAFEQTALQQATIDHLAAGGSALQVYAAIKEGGFTLAQAETILGAVPGSLEEEARKMGLPTFAIGTNYVPRTGFALLHEGEAVVPTAYNPAANPGMAGGNTERLERLVEGLTAEVQRLQAIVAQGNDNTKQLADQFDQVSAGGNAIATETLT